MNRITDGEQLTVRYGVIARIDPSSVHLRFLPPCRPNPPRLPRRPYGQCRRRNLRPDRRRPDRPADGPAQPAPARRACRWSTRSTLTTGGNVCNTGIAMAKLGHAASPPRGWSARTSSATAVARAARAERPRHRRRSSITDSAQTSATRRRRRAGRGAVFFHTPGVDARCSTPSVPPVLPGLQAVQFVQVGYFGLLPALTPDLPELLRGTAGRRPADARSRSTR